MEDHLKIVRGFPAHLRQSAAEIYFDAFEQKIGWVLGGKEKAIAFIASIIDPKFSLCAISGQGENEKIVGLAGYKTNDGALVGGGFSSLAASFGFFSSLWRAPILALLDREVEPDVLLMDGIAVISDQRGKGTGTKLLQSLATHAKDNGYKYVRLDVIDNNRRARALYERHGFLPKDTDELGPLKHLFGFSSSTRMVLQVSHSLN